MKLRCVFLFLAFLFFFRCVLNVSFSVFPPLKVRSVSICKSEDRERDDKVLLNYHVNSLLKGKKQADETRKGLVNALKREKEKKKWGGGGMIRKNY